MIDDPLYKFFYFEKKQQLHFIVKELPEYSAVYFWVWDYGQGHALFNKGYKFNYEMPTGDCKYLSSDEEIMKYLSPIMPDFFNMIFESGRL